MTRVGIAGAAGRMGRALARAVTDHPALVFAGAWEAPGHPAIGQDAGLLAGLPEVGVRVADKVSLSGLDLAIDFTTATATVGLTDQAVKAGTALVIGTTGLSVDDLSRLKHAAERIPLVYATNYATGINLLEALARKAATVLGEQYDIEIVEAHHNQKKDAPSGTALTLLEAVCQGRGLDPAKSVRHGREGMAGPRDPGEVGVHAVRAGDIVGDHTILFAGQGERLELRHQAHTRDTLARGAVRAAAWLAGKPAGWYRMTDVLGLGGI